MSEHTYIIQSGAVRLILSKQKPEDGLSITVQCEPDQKALLRFDCFLEEAHYHMDPEGKDIMRTLNIKGLSDPVRWTLEQITKNLPSLLLDAGFPEAAQKAQGEDMRDAIRELRQALPAFQPV
jgi:hypothetical protein